MRLEDSLKFHYLAVASFGLTTVVQVSGIFMLIAGIGLAIIGVVMLRLRRPTLRPA